MNGEISVTAFSEINNKFDFSRFEKLAYQKGQGSDQEDQFASVSLKTTQSKLCGRAANHKLKTPADLYLPPSQQYIAKSLSEHVDSFRSVC